MAQSPQLVEIATRHQVYLERLKSGESNQFAAFLLQIDRSIRARLAGEVMTEFTRARLEKLLAAVERDLNRIFDSYYEHLSGHLLELGQYEAGFEARSLDKITVGYEAVVPTEIQVIAAVTTRPLSVRGADGGKLLETFIKDWSANEVKRVSGAIRQGFYEGQTTAQILQAVRGTRANQYRDGILSIVNRDAEAVVRTAVQHVASVARQLTWERNADLVKGVRWVSTLDSRTTQQCRSLDGRRFALDKGPRPPIHIRCRSTTVAELDPEFRFLREGATRASVNGQVSADLTYYEWLKQQPVAFQNSAIGPARAALLRNGGLSAERFAELNLGRNFEPLSLAEMRKLEPLAFAKAYSAAPLTKQAQNATLSESAQRRALELWMGERSYRQTVGEVVNPRIKRLADEYGLTVPERVAVRHYTGTGYSDLNRHLWGDRVDKPGAVGQSVEVLRSGLGKMPNFEGVVFRRTTLPSAVLAQHKVGNVVEYQAFTSASHSMELFEGEHRVILDGRSGKSVGWISRYNDDEREVVFNAPTRFLVRDRYIADDGVLTIELVEL